jgi:thiol peroxidase
MERQVSRMGGNIVTLLGKTPNLGDMAPDFALRDQDLLQVTLATYTGKVKLFSVVPSIDTTVCDLQTKRFDKETAGKSEELVVASVSMDLPFALKRWAASCKIKNVLLLSDYMDSSFGTAYGVLIKELKLLNRSIFIVDRQDTVQYIEIVDENHNHPNYERALAALTRVLKGK